MAQDNFLEYDEDGYLIGEGGPYGIPGMEDAILDTEQTLPDILPPKNFVLGSAAMCTDRYPQDAIRFEFSVDQVTYDPGYPITIAGSIANTTSSPLMHVDGYAQLVRNNPNGSDGYVILDEFQVFDNETILPGESREIESKYLLPLNAPAGEYEIRFFALENGMFLLTPIRGVPSAVLSVSGTEEQYAFVSEPFIVYEDPLDEIENATFDEIQDAVAELRSQTIGVSVSNPSSGPASLNVTLSLYKDAAMTDERRVESKSQQVTVGTEGSAVVEFDLSTVRSSGYYAKVVSEPVDNGGRDRSVFSGRTISTTYLSVGDESVLAFGNVGILSSSNGNFLVGCVSGAGENGDRSDVRVELVARTSSGKEIARVEYSGIILPGTNGFEQQLASLSKFSEILVEARIYSASGEVLDEVARSYSCSDFGGDSCGKEGGVMGFFVAGGLLVLLVIVLLLRRRSSINSLSV